jgi:hypothetical protein
MSSTTKQRQPQQANTSEQIEAALSSMESPYCDSYQTHDSLSDTRGTAGHRAAIVSVFLPSFQSSPMGSISYQPFTLGYFTHW